MPNEEKMAMSLIAARMGWEFPYVSTYNTEFPFDFELALTEEQAQQTPEIKGMVDNPPDWLVEWSHQIGSELKDGLREGARSARRAILQLPARPHA